MSADDTHVFHLDTRCIHAGESLDERGGLHVPLYNHSTFGFESTEELLDVVDGRSDGNLYTRFGLNPTIRAVEEKLADLEDAAAAYAFSSGMAAISATLMAHCQAGDHVVCVGDVYGGTYELMETNLSQLDIETTFLLGDQVDALDEHLTDRTRVVFFETPTNPNMEIFDISSIAEITATHDALTVVDNTFASPINQNPLAHGADLVIHSTTKYLGGHSDLTGGAVMGSDDLLEPIALWRKNLGQMVAPEVAFLLARSLRTLGVRVRRQTRSAQQIAEFLDDHPRIRTVNYPGLPHFPGHEIAKRQMRGFGGMVSFIYDGDAESTAAMVDQLDLYTIAPSLGGVESLVTQPITTTHHDMDPAERARRGIADSMVRLSTGLEAPEDLIADLDQALS